MGRLGLQSRHTHYPSGYLTSRDWIRTYAPIFGSTYTIHQDTIGLPRVGLGCCGLVDRSSCSCITSTRPSRATHCHSSITSPPALSPTHQTSQQTTFRLANPRL